MKRNPAPLVICGLLALAAAATAPSMPPPSAPAATGDPVAALLEAVDAAELARWLAGEDPSGLRAKDGRSLREVLRGLGLGPAVAWFTIDGGGGQALGGSLRLRGTLGQPDAARSLGPEPSLTGGFWADSVPALVFADGFESGTTAAWSAAAP